MRSQLKGIMLGNPVIDCPDYGININRPPLLVELLYYPSYALNSPQAVQFADSIVVPSWVMLR